MHLKQQNLCLKGAIAVTKGEHLHLFTKDGQYSRTEILSQGGELEVHSFVKLN